MISDRFALQAWLKAESCLAEGLVQQPDVAPGATVHLAYFAMFHAARAVLLRATGDAPKKHASVIGQFGHFVRERSLALKQAGHDLNEVEASRIIADYHEAGAVSAENARDALASAVAFLDLCAQELGFPRSKGTRGG